VKGLYIPRRSLAQRIIKFKANTGTKNTAARSNRFTSAPNFAVRQNSQVIDTGAAVLEFFVNKIVKSLNSID